MSEPDENQSTYELLMPFVTVVSKGGPHDDEAYSCGWEMGQLDAKLATLRTLGDHITISVTMHMSNLPQADLIAMRHGYVGAVIETGGCEISGGWAQVNYSPAQEQLEP